jgi:predicted amidohydrolase
MRSSLALAVALLGMGVAGLADGSPPSPSPASFPTVRVAAIQCPAEMGATEENIARLMRLVRQAADGGARIIVTPECAVQGYMHPETMASWTVGAPHDDHLPVQPVAEPIPGPVTARFAPLAKELGVYLCLGMVELAPGGRFHNAQVLFGPDGEILAHHRKRMLWTPGDGQWCDKGDHPVQVVDSPYGRLGLMICFDFHALPKLLAEQQADIVLYSVGWYGPNEASWFGEIFPRNTVVPNRIHVVAANWSAPSEDIEWPGRGHSCVIRRDGVVLAMAATVVGDEIVFADLPVASGP